MSRQNDIKKLLINYNRRLQALKERKALYGLDTPLAVLTEIEDIEAEIEQLQAELKELEVKPPPTILLADSNQDFVSIQKEQLEREGFEVIVAFNATEARIVLNRGNVNLAIVSVRLADDNDERDISGLILAKTPAYQNIPKIILTDFPNNEAVIEALRPASGVIPASVNFLSKREGPDVMIRAVKRILSSPVK